MPNNNGLIFDTTKIEHCTQRIAYQIYEANFDYKEIYRIVFMRTLGMDLVDEG